MKNNKDQSLPDDSKIKIYELILKNKEHQEDKRDSINSYYNSLFTAILSGMALIDRIKTNISLPITFYTLGLSYLLLSAICILLAWIWAANLKRILYSLEITDKLLLTLEKKCNIYFITYLNQELQHKKAPRSITKYQILLPYIYMVIVSASVIFHLYNNLYNT